MSRLVVRSVPRPTEGDDALRQVCAGVEDALVAMPLPTMVVRTSLVDAPDLRDALVSAAGTLPDTDVEVAPLHTDDVVDALVALDAARSTTTEGHLVLRLQGTRQPLRGYLDHLGDAMVGRVYVPASRVPLLAPSLMTPWGEPDDDTTADLLAFAELTPRPLSA